MTPYYQHEDVTLYCGDALSVLAQLPAESVQCVVTSPPFFGLRDYGCVGQIGLESNLNEYLNRLVGVFGELRRVLRPDGVCWVEMGDSYAGGGQGNQGGTGQRAGRSFTLTRDPTLRKDRQAFRPGNPDKNGGVSNRDGLGQVPTFKPKDLLLVPHRFAIAMQADGWWVRQDIVWHKIAPMPESVGDRCTRAHSYVFMFTKSEKYYYDASAIAEPAEGRISPTWDERKATGERTRRGDPGAGEWKDIMGAGWGSLRRTDRNKRSVWEVTPEPFSGAHFATFPTKLVEPCILAGSRPGDVVLDPFAGSGTVGLVARKFGRQAMLIELNPTYCAMAVRRIEGQTPALPLEVPA